MSEGPVSPQEALVVEATETKSGFAETSSPRKEDNRLVQGQGVFIDDVRRHGMGFVHFVGSPHAHAKILSIDVTAALELDGVYGTLTGDEVAILTDPLFELSVPPGGSILDYALAVGKTRFAGEPVVAVVAATRDLARDAAELVEVEYEPLSPLLDARLAQDRSAPILHDRANSNIVWEGTFDWGDWEGAVADSDHVVRISELHFDRFSSAPLECAGALVEYDRGAGQWTMHCNHQMPGLAALWMAPVLRCGIDKLRFVTQDIGGAFGNRTCLPYLVACCLLARKLNRPVQWTEWRTDQHVANAPGNERWFQDVEVAVQADGTLLGFRCKAVDDCGAFPRYEPLGCIVWAQVAPGCYRWQNVRVDFMQVVTNKSPVSADRGYSPMQHLWLTERIIDIVAHELDLDPVAIRKRNYVQSDEFPWTTPNGSIYDSGDYGRCLDVALDLVGASTIDDRRREAESRGRLLGLGIGSTLDPGTNTFGQSQLLNPDLQFSGNTEVATVKLDIFGEIVVTLEAVPQGQGRETTSTQVVVDILGCAPDDVTVRPGHDPYWNSHAGGGGAYASEFAVTGPGAVKGAADKLAQEIRIVAGAVFGGLPPERILLEGGFAKIAANPEAAIPFMGIGAIVNANSANLPQEVRDTVTLNCRHVYVPPFEVADTERNHGNLTLTYASQIHACVVEVDPETGVYEIVDYAAVDDCGTRIHPQILEGRVHGAIAQALGAATHETFAYDEDGNLLTPNLYDYHVPHALDMPPLKTGFVESASPFTPLGAKGVGDGGGAGIHAVSSALQDALKPVGGPIVHDSCNPPERVWELITHPEASRGRVSVESRS